MILSHAYCLTLYAVDFEKANALALHGAILDLHSFDSDFSATSWVQGKTKNVMAMQSDILDQASNSKSFSKEMAKMQVLADVFPGLHSIYTETCQQVLKLLDDSVEELSKAELSTLHEWSHEEVCLFIDKLLLLQAMSECTVLDESNLEHARVCLGKVLKDLLAMLESWALTANDVAEGKSRNLEEDMKHLLARAVVLQTMETSFEKKDLRINSLDKAVASTARSLESDTIGAFNSLCGDLMESSSFDPSLESKLRWMRDVCQRSSNLHCGQWRKMQSSYSGKHRAVFDPEVH